MPEHEQGTGDRPHHLAHGSPEQVHKGRPLKIMPHTFEPSCRRPTPWGNLKRSEQKLRKKQKVSKSEYTSQKHGLPRY